jgi:3-hydroxymyristoyl/3-hydroxydecanoyl-(acyl carrier protein) dehydratase
MRLDAKAGTTRQRGSIESAYDFDENCWYFRENGAPTMPFVVILEAALQPCGWFMFYLAEPNGMIGQSLRNLDGTGIFYEALPPDPTTMRVEIDHLSTAHLGGTQLSTFKLRGFVGQRCICEVETSFGVFPPEALIEQVGVAASAQDRARIAAPGDFHLDLTTRPARYFSGPVRLPGPMLLMIQRVTALDPTGGHAGLGWIRAEKDVDPAEWFFKAHFFQDPVQPGSLGLEALLQLLQTFMIERGLADNVPHARFEPIMLGRKLTWKYRGQVVPENKLIVTEIEVGEIGRDARGPFVIAQGWLWVDGIRIYHATDIGMRIVSAA